MADQSVIDVKFKDVMARDLKSVLGKTLDELVKDLVKSSEDALGVSGTMTNLGIIPKKDGTIGGVRFAVDSAVGDDVKKALRDRLGRYAEKAGVGQVASVLSNARAKAFKESYIRLPDNDPGFAKEVLDFVENSGGKIIWSGHNEEKAYMNLRVRLPQSHLRGDKLSTVQRFNAYRAQSDNTILSIDKELKAAARAEAAREKDAGYISEADMLAQEERRRQLGIVTDEGDSVAKEQEQTGYFNKSLLYFAAISETVRRILNFVSKIYENALQLSYSAKASNVDADKLRALELALQGFGVDKGAARSAVGLIAGGLMNPLQLNEGLINTIAPVLGQDSADLIKDMLMGEGDTMGALSMIMEAARNKVASGGFTGTKDKAKAYAEVHKQLAAAGGGLESVFEAYMRAVDKDFELNKGVGEFDFRDFLRLFSVSGTENAADAAIQKSYLDTLIEREGLNYLFTNTYNPGKLWTNYKSNVVPYRNKLDFYNALREFGVTPAADADISTLKEAVDSISPQGLSDTRKNILKRLKDTVKTLDAWKSQKGVDYWETQGYDLPMPRRYSVDGTLESMIQGTEPAAPGGVNYFDNTSTTTMTQAEPLMDTRFILEIRNGGDVVEETVAVGTTNSFTVQI